MTKPLIFITNDDGVGAKGLWSIVEAAREIGEVVVVAPEQHQSGKAHAITMFEPLTLRKVREEGNVKVYACSGTPVDCVKMGLDYLLKDRKPDIAVAGINHGANSAVSVLYSGTMGAAIEASFFDCPSIGLSLLDGDPDADFSAAAEYAADIIRKVLKLKITERLCLNVNIPAVKKEKIRGIRLCRQSKGYWKESFVKREDPRGGEYFWLTGEFVNTEPESKDTDEWMLAQNYISVVPIQVDMTNHEQVIELASLL